MAILASFSVQRNDYSVIANNERIISVSSSLMALLGYGLLEPLPPRLSIVSVTGVQVARNDALGRYRLTGLASLHTGVFPPEKVLSLSRITWNNRESLAWEHSVRR